MKKNIVFWATLVTTLITAIILIEDSGLLAIFAILGHFSLKWVLGILIAIVLCAFISIVPEISDFMAVKTLKADKYPEDTPEIKQMYTEVIEASATKNPSLRKTKLFVVGGDVPNGYVIGGKNIYISYSTAMIGTERLQGIIAHELGHIYHRHTLGNRIANSLNALIYVVFRAIQFLLQLQYIITGLFINVPILGFFAKWFLKLYEVEIEVAKFMYESCAEELIGYFQRKSIDNEFEADGFAADIGFGPQLKSALIYLNNTFDLKGNEIPSETHPLLSERINLLDEGR